MKSEVLGELHTELYLISRGVRDLCWFPSEAANGEVSEKEIVPHIQHFNSYGMKFREICLLKTTVDFILYAKGCEKKAQKLKELIALRSNANELHYQIGKLLGYSGEAIEQFMSVGDSHGCTKRCKELDYAKKRNHKETEQK